MSSQQSLTTAIEAFSQYYTLSHVDLSRMRSTLNKLPRYNKRLAYDVGTSSLCYSSYFKV